MDLNSFRQELATPRTSIQLCLIGIVGGVCAASLIILFRLSIEWLQGFFLTDLNQFAALDPIKRLLLPIIGAMAILLVAYLTGLKHYRIGIPFVIHRIKHHFGHIPFRTTINQFFGGAVALACGFSVGQEGPSVHLGASGSSFFGQWLRLPDNSIRILSGCGIAAGISASFNTPFAAVIFVMEVVLREYKIHVFIPIMLAAACGTLLTRIVFGEAPALSFIQFNDFSRWIYLYLILFGVVLGFLATVFNNTLMMVMRSFSQTNMLRRLLLASVITGGIGLILPDALGAHFHSARDLLEQQSNISLLIALLGAKFLLTIVAIGLGIPGGVIGPVFVLGMLTGILLTTPLGWFMQDVSELSGSFALLGMAGLMTAVVHAPLAALSAVMELSYSPQLILPAILVIVPAYVTSTQLLGNRSIFIRQLDYQRLPYRTSTVLASLQKTGVLAVMDTNFRTLEDPDENLVSIFETYPNMQMVRPSKEDVVAPYTLVSYDRDLDGNSTALLFTPMQGVRFQATLAEVYERLEGQRKGAVYVFSDNTDKIVGIITWRSLRRYLHKARY
jgi:H+/Cl- antiporter ClcA